MVSRWLLSLLICIVVFAIPVKAAETTLVRDVLGPEGPLYIDGKLYYVGWVSNALSMWDGKTSVVLNRAPNCGHNGLAVTARKTFMLACTNDPGAILEL